MSLPVSYTIPQWCAAYHVSRAHYYTLREQGLAPQELKLGRRVIITRRAAEQWEDQMMRQQSFTGGLVVL
jgi:predicted DNA-binding transcriptional regulator AlpA